MNAITPALELRDIDKRFGSTVALSRASLSVSAGTLHVLLGENGAGKTTLLRIAAGILQPDSGTLALDGRPVHWTSRMSAIRSGIAVVEQHFSLVPALTVGENVAMASAGLWTQYTARRAAARVKDVAGQTGLSVDPAAIVGELPVAAQQRVEIVKALSRNPSLLIMDEPTALLSPAESEELFAWLRRFVASGRSAVVITHRVRDAMQHGDFLTVLRAGRATLSAPRSAVTRADVVAAILGESSPEAQLPTRRAIVRSDSPAIAELIHVSVRDPDGVQRVRDASVMVRSGEIVGVAGVEGSGSRELLRILAGRLAPASGTVRLPANTRFIAEDRLREGVIGEMSLTENWALRDLGHRAGSLPWKRFAGATEGAIRDFSIRAGSPDDIAASLSGGNQQRLVLARELEGAPELIVAENPGRGLDLRASADAMRRLAAARDAGAGVVLYSSDLDDLVGIADRVLVCFAGSVREVSPDFDAIGNAMLGGA